MFNTQLGKELRKVLQGELSSSIAYQNSRGIEARENHTLNHRDGFFRGSFTTWDDLYPLGYIINQLGCAKIHVSF
jgi:hypothetical protein